MRLSILRLLLMVTILALSASVAMGQGSLELLNKGKSHYKLGEFSKSVKWLKRASRATRGRKQLAQVYLYLGLNYVGLEKLEQAKKAYAAALKHDASVEMDPVKFNPTTVKLFRKIRSGMLGKLRIAGPSKAQVWIDGQQRGAIPLELELHVGAHEIKVLSADGSSDYTGRVIVYLDQTIEVEAKLTLLKGRLKVLSTPPGAEVLEQGKRLGPTPLALSLTPGKHQLSIRLSGYLPLERTVELAPGKSQVVEVELKPVSVPGEPAAVTSPATEKKDAAPRPGRRRLWTWIAAGGAAVALGVGIGLGVSAKSAHDEFETTEDVQRYWELKDSVEEQALGANIAFGVAGGLAVSAAVLFFLEGRSADRSTKAADASRSLRVIPALGSTIGLSLARSF